MNSAIFKKIIGWITLPEKITLLKWGSWFFFFTGLIQLVIGLKYLTGFSFPQDALGGIYTVSAYVGHFLFLSYAAWMVVILPLTLLIPRKKVIVPLAIFWSAFILAATLLDALVFGDNRFHMSTLIMSILGMKTWLFGLLYLGIFLFFATFLAKRVESFMENPKRLLSGFLVSSLSILLLVLSHALHIWGDANYYTPITRFSTFMPLFYPATAKKFMIKHGLANLEQARDEANVKELNKDGGNDLLYPLSPLTFSTPVKKQNILFIVIDAMKADALTEELAPNILHFSKEKIVFKNHYSGGNSSKMGAFSLFYGLPATYCKYFESVGKSPVLIDTLEKEQYQFGIFSSAPLYRPTSIDRTVFANFRNLRLETKSEINESYARDQKINQEWLTWLENRDKSRPFFGLLFYDAPTSKSYPPEYENRFPRPEKQTKLQERHRKYKTAISFDDDLVSAVLNDLKAKDLLQETIIIITADHGEEFDENGLGFSGHGSSYSRFQLQVPLIISWPGKSSQTISKRTSHNDIAPTLIEEALGCLNPSSDYASGKNIFKGPQWDWLIVGSYYNFAILEPHQTTISYPGGYFEMRDDRYTVISNKHLNRRVLKAALNESVKFFNQR